MGTILLMLLFPIGVVTYFWDKKVYAQGLETFVNYILKIKNADISNEEKIDKIDHMFYDNNYKIVQKDKTFLVVERKHFNIGILFMVFGLLNYFGAIAYVVFYKFFLKPRRLMIDLLSDEALSKENF